MLNQQDRLAVAKYPGLPGHDFVSIGRQYRPIAAIPVHRIPGRGTPDGRRELIPAEASGRAPC